MSAIGFVDHLSNVRAIGWAKSANGSAVEIEACLEDGRTIARGMANVSRADVGPHGFDLVFERPIPADLKVRIGVVGGDTLCVSLPKVAVVPKDVKHRLRVPLYASPFLDELAAEEKWDADRVAMLRSFAQNGLLRIRIERPDFPDIAARLTRLKYSKQPRIQDGWKDNADIRALACDAGVMRTLHLLFGREAIPMQTLNFPVGTEQPTHTDTVHFNSQPAHFMCGVWVAMERIGPENGTLHYYPGSQKLPIIDLDDIGVVADKALWSTNYEYHQELLHELIRINKLKKELVYAEPGDAIIWAANLAHGGEPILKPGATRHSQVTHYYFAGCSYYTPMLSNVHLNQYHRPWRPDIRTGELLTHHFEELPMPFEPSV